MATAPKKSDIKEKGSASPLDFTKEQELKALREMLLIRRFEEKAGQLYGMSVTLSCDHRAIDGALGAELIGAFRQLIENPVMMMV